MKPMNNEAPKSPLRSRDKQSKFFIDNEFVEKGYLTLPPSEIKLYLVIAKYANSQRQDCWPSYGTLMLQSGIKSRATIANGLKALINRNMIRIVRIKERRSNTYQLIHCFYWRRSISTPSCTDRPVQSSTTNQFNPLNTTSTPSSTLNPLSNSLSEVIESNNKNMGTENRPPEKFNKATIEENQRLLRNAKSGLLRSMDMKKR